MAHTLIFYASNEGQTAKIAAFIAAELNEAGHVTRLLDAGSVPADFSLDFFDSVIVGGSVHMGRHQRALCEWVCRHRVGLSARPHAFFSVSLAAASDGPTHQAQVKRYLHDFVAGTGWEPARVAPFAGALRYSQYDELQRFVLSLAGAWGADDEGAADTEYTDWEAVTAFAEAFMVDCALARQARLEEVEEGRR